MYILTNGKIYTLEGRDWVNNPAEAMAVGDDGKIIAIGSDKEVRAVVDKTASVIDLYNETVFPGFIDSHVHIPGTAFTELYQINFYGIFDREGTLKQTKKFIVEHPDEDVYFGSGFNAGVVQVSDNEMPKQWLDDICSNKPIILRSYDAHSFWLNSCAMRTYGITEETVTHSSGVIQKNSKGELKGVFSDVFDIGIPEPSYSHNQEIVALKYFMNKMNSWGFTGVTSVAPTFNIDMHCYKDVIEDKSITLRASLCWDLYQQTFNEDFVKLRQMRQELKADTVHTITAKLFMDGVLEGKTACLKEPYIASADIAEGYNGKLPWSQEELNERMKEIVKNDFQVHIHSIGDAATNMALNALENVAEECAKKNLRNTITHLQVVDPQDINRFAKYNVIAAIQPFWHLKEPEFYDLIDKPYLGVARAEHEYPAKSFVDKGVKITSSGDYPVSFMNDPFMAIRAGVTRNLYSPEYYGIEITNIDDSRFLLNADERLSVKDMIEAYTINGAYQMNMDDKIGSLKPGKYADYIIVSKDPFVVSPIELNSIQVIKTFYNGNQVFERGE